MQNKTISSNGLAVELITEGLDINSLWKDIVGNELLTRFVPGLTGKGRVVDTLKIINSEGNKQLALEKGGSYIQGKYGTDFTSTDVIVLCDYLLERYRQEKVIYAVQSSAVFKGNNGVLLLANLTGAGKTSTSIYLKERHKFNLYSDEKTLLNAKSQELVGQTQRVHLEQKTKDVLKSVGIMVNSDMGIAHTSPKKLKLIVVPIVADGLNAPIVRKYSSAKLKWMLYEEMTKNIRFVNGMIFNMSVPLMSLDTLGIAQERLNQASLLSKAIPCYFIQGSLSAVSNEINDLLQG